MPFEEGNNLGKGRPKGSKNERTEKINALIDKMLDECEGTILDDLRGLEAKERLDIVCKLLEYKIPKLQRTTVQGDKEADAIKLTVDFKNATTDDLTKLIEATDTSDTDGGD